MTTLRRSLLVIWLVLAPGLAGCGGNPGGSTSGTPGGSGTPTAPQAGGGLQGPAPGNLNLAGILNANNGALDRVLNDFLQLGAWAKSALPNFDSVSDILYRGGQPRPADGWTKLRKMGIRTVVNLRLEDNSEEEKVRALEMIPVYLPIPDTSVPTVEQVRRFRSVLASADSGRIYVHCSAGKFRTSTMVAIYQIDRGATADQALADARRHGFKPNWLDSPKEEAFIRDYAANRSRWQ
ncbi:MAG: tyrosine-protein phosphatase [Candidatus Riflebacteria bacterium]|nr:tyrosine-protein phosphatase [Candidatus Riflebacteria bacterium]